MISNLRKTLAFPLTKLMVGTLLTIAGLSAHAQNVRLLPLGDSITYGEKSTTGVGYRGPLWDLLIKEVEQLDFVGSQQHGTMADSDNEGHSGWRIDAIASLTTGTVTKYRPNIVTVHLGTNDVVQDFQMSTAPDRLGALIDQIFTAAPDATVLVSNIVPASDAGRQARIVAFNAKVPGIVQARANAGKHVLFVDMSRVSLADMAEGLHPNDNGYRKMAEAWNEGIKKVIGYGWIKDPVPRFQGKYQIQNVGSKLAVTVAGASTMNSAAITQNNFNNADESLWTFEPGNMGYYAIKNAKSGLYWNVSGGSTAQGGSVIQWPSQGTGSTNDRWQPVDNGDSTYTFVNLNSHQALDVPGGSLSAGTPLQQWGRNTTTAQKFKLIPQGAINLVATQSGRCLDNANTANNAKALIWDCTGEENQRWVRGANDSLQASFGKCLDVLNQGTTAGSTVGIWDCTGSPNQQWLFSNDGSIVSAQSGLCLDISGGGTGNGSAVVLWNCTGGTNQKWALR